VNEYCGLPLIIKRNVRAKRVLVKLVPGRGLEVVVPKCFDANRVPEILNEKRAWIDKTRAALESSGADLSGRIPDLPEIVSFCAIDRVYKVDYLDRPGKNHVTENVTRIVFKGPMDDQESVLEGLRKFTTRKAREALLPLLENMSRRLGMPYAAMRVRRQRTRWGSCSAKGSISLNAKLLFLPVELVNHLLLHELCHTRQLNHSSSYWALVARHEPDYLHLEKSLANANHHVPGWFV